MNLTWRDYVRFWLLKHLGVLVLSVRPPHDVIVLRFDERRVPPVTIARLGEYLEKVSGCKVALLTSGVKIAAVLHVDPAVPR